MKIPHIKFLTVLVAERLDNQEDLKELQQHSLQVPQSKEVNALRETLKLGQAKYFGDIREVVETSWLHELGIEAMFGFRNSIQVAESIDGIKGSYKVINDKAIYRIITSLAMSGVIPEDIELIINGKYDIEYSSNDLDTFLYYFFNLDGWSHYDKEAYVTSVKDGQLRMFYAMALEEEKDYLMWKLGIASNKSFPQMLRDMRDDTFYNFKEQSNRNPEMAMKWGQLALKVDERLEKVEAELQAKSDMHEDIEFVFRKGEKDEEEPVEEKKKDIREPEEIVTENPFKGINPKLIKESPPIMRPEDLN